MIDINAKLEDAGIVMDTFSSGVQDSFLRGVGHTADSARGEWIRLAQNRLSTSRADYIDGLQKPDSMKYSRAGTRSTWEIQLVGRMPNNFEFGMDSFDMKAVRPGWLGGGKAKTAKAGHKYVTIPFRHSTTSPARIAYSGQARRANLQRELRTVVRRYGLDRMVRTATGAPVTGPVARVPTTARVHPYLRGLTRIQGPSSPRGGRVSGQLFTFRTMSELSPDEAWNHPGITAANLMPEVEIFIERELNLLIDRVFGVRR